MQVLRALGIGVVFLGIGCSKKTPSSFPSLDEWQGNARVVVERDGKTSSLHLSRQGHVVRFEAPDDPELFGTYGGEGTRHYLLDDQSRLLTLVVDGSKQALDFDVTALAAATPTRPDPSFELSDTGRGETVAGHRCQLWTGKDHDTQVSACVVSQSASALALGAGFLPEGAGWGRMLLDGKHVPLSVHVTRGGQTVFAARLESIDQAAPQGTFSVPADYERHDFVEALKKVHERQR